METTTAGISIQSPQLDINTVAAGGGSILAFNNQLFVVGPESAGAHPGPACYRKGGPATVTDANLYLGRLVPDFFPKIFGPGANEALDEEASAKALQKLTDQINSETGRDMTVDEVAHGFLKVANEAMVRPILSITQAKGHDSSKHRLATFGGAGGQHAVAIAEALGIRQVLVHRYSSLLSAYGMALADVVDEQQEPDSSVWQDAGHVVDALKTKMARLKAQSAKALRAQGFSDNDIAFEEYLHMRYRGTESALMVIKPAVDEFGDEWAFGKAFVAQHRYEFGFTLDDRDVIVDDVRVRGVGKSPQADEPTVDQLLKEMKENKMMAKVTMSALKSCPPKKVYFDSGRIDTPVLRLEDLREGDVVPGPAILADGTQTVVVTPSWQATILKTHVLIELGNNDEAGAGADAEAINKESIKTPKVDPIMLSIFGHRFMAIAEQMGRALQKTSVSTNVKERLDFSCAIFDPSGGLVAVSVDGDVDVCCSYYMFMLTPRLECSSSSRPPWLHVDLHPHPGPALAGQARQRRRHHVEPPVLGRHPSARRHCHHARVRLGREGNPLLRRRAGPPRRYWRNNRRQHAAAL